jgi:DNA-binding GntR family transcriptional regulator
MMKTASNKLNATNIIRDLIVTGKLKPNENIEICHLSSTYNLQKQDVAEALSILENEGFVTYSSEGPVVRQISKEEIDEWIQKRYSLELDIVEKLTSDIDENKLAIIERSLKEQEDAFQSNDVVKFLELNADFHYQLASLAGFPTAAHWFKIESARLRINGLQALDNPTKLRNCYEEHEAIVNSLKSGLPVIARKAMKKHLEKTKERITVK